MSWMEENITKSKLSSFDDMQVTQDTNISPYIVMSYLTSLLNFHVGFGGERFQFSDKSNAKFKELEKIQLIILQGDFVFGQLCIFEFLELHKYYPQLKDL